MMPVAIIVLAVFILIGAGMISQAIEETGRKTLSVLDFLTIDERVEAEAAHHEKLFGDGPNLRIVKRRTDDVRPDD